MVTDEIRRKKPVKETEEKGVMRLQCYATVFLPPCGIRFRRVPKGFSFVGKTLTVRVSETRTLQKKSIM